MSGLRALQLQKPPRITWHEVVPKINVYTHVYTCGKLIFTGFQIFILGIEDVNEHKKKSISYINASVSSCYIIVITNSHSREAFQVCCIYFVIQSQLAFKVGTVTVVTCMLYKIIWHSQSTGNGCEVQDEADLTLPAPHLMCTVKFMMVWKLLPKHIAPNHLYN